MSWVTNIILHLGLGDDRRIDEINKFFGDQKGFVSIDDPILPRGWYGGCKMMEAELYLGAFNHIDVAALTSHLRSINFESPDAVQLIIKDQEEEVFSIVRVFSQVHQFAEPNAPPNGGPATSVDNPNALGGPPSVS